jgi:hypothetical protein
LRTDCYRCLTARAAALFELTDALLCTDGPVKTLVDLALAPEHQPGPRHALRRLGCGRIEVDRLRVTLAGLPCHGPPMGGSCWAWTSAPWLRWDAPTSPERLSATSTAFHSLCRSSRRDGTAAISRRDLDVHGG